MSVQTERKTSLEVEHLCDWSIELEPVQTIPTPFGTRLTYVLKEGSCQGERLRGEFLPGGGDWVMFGNDGIARVDVRATLRTDDDQLIHVTNSGVVVMDEETMSRWMAGEFLAQDQMYARTQPRFETAAEDYAWLNGVVTVAINQLGRAHVDYEIYRVL
jgi:Protein of unknown function (DUF3237)